MSWRVAKSLLVLRDQINALSPNRNKAADGTIGDKAHAAVASDHNPNAAGVVTALDITHDPARGVDAGKIARMLAATKDERIKYLISNGQICAGTGGPSPWVWRKYTGRNPHSQHFHLSVLGSPALYDNERPWSLNGELFVPDKAAPIAVVRPMLRKGDKGDTVKVLQRLLTGLVVDGDFGPKTDKAVREFQKRNGLVADGIVGPYSWAKLIP